MARMDSIKQAKLIFLQQQKEKEEEDSSDEEISIDTTNNTDVVPKSIKRKPTKDSGKKAYTFNNAAILTDERNYIFKKKTIKA